jgi:hypothetical protein
MNAPGTVLAPTSAMRRLADFLQVSGSRMSPTEAATLAINEWIAAAQGRFTNLAPTPTRGYQWKTLFLPEGTELRMRFGGRSFYARVERDAIWYQGQRVSPRQMTIAIAGDGHNAWRELWIRRPTDSQWRPASLLRRQAGAAEPLKPVSPAEAMSAAAACMSETLRTALALVDHTNGRALPRDERRVDNARRASDRLAGACAFD